MQTTLPGSSFAALLIISMSCLVLPEPFTPRIKRTIVNHSCFIIDYGHPQHGIYVRGYFSGPSIPQRRGKNNGET